MTPTRRVFSRVLTWSLLLGGAIVMLATAAVILPGQGVESAAATPPPPTTTTSTPTTTAPIEEPVAAPIPTSTTSTTAPDDEEPSPEPPPAPENLAPTRVRIPSIGVDATIIDLGLNPDRTLEVPKDFDDTGWYTGRSVPGEIGPGVVVGHVDSAAYGPAVFYRLRELVPGDLVEIDRSDGSVAVFRVTDMVLVHKDDFPTQDVYGLTDQPTLRLITCGGRFDKATRSHIKNLIIYAEHLGNRTHLLSPYGSGRDNPIIGHRI